MPKKRYLKKLTKYGNSYAVILEKDLLKLLEIDENTPIEVSTDGYQLLLCPQRFKDGSKRIRKAWPDTDGTKHKKQLQRGKNKNFK